MLAIVTGAIGVGKTTVCQKVIAIVRDRGFTCGGVIARKTGDGSITVEDVDSGGGMPLASTHVKYHGPQTGKYWFNPEGISFGMDAIRRGAGSDILVVDEVGHLELEGEGFSSAAEILRDRRAGNSMVVVRSELLEAFLPLLGSATRIFTVAIDNRDSLPDQLAAVLAVTPSQVLGVKGAADAPTRPRRRK
jgi:nucleoside-triphosphatase THEP1